jgi:hypothetical protein
VLLDPTEEDEMALARVVTFEGVGTDRIEQLRNQIDQGDRPDDLPASEIIVLHDPEAERSVTIIFFENEDDYARGDTVLNAMPAPETPGQRTSVTRYDVAIRRSM